MKVLMLNGSPREGGNTSLALAEMRRVFEENGVEVELLQVGDLAIRGCRGCAACYKLGRCAIDDIVNELAPKLQECDGMVVGSPVYYAAASAKYFTISGMPVAAGQYWNSVHGARFGEAAEDLEGLQGMRTLANNMLFLMRSIALGKEKFGLPETEKTVRTNFIR